MIIIRVHSQCSVCFMVTYSSLNWNILRSTDGLNFTNIGTKSATGTPSTTTNYTFTDATPAIGVNFYQLELVSSGGIPLQKSKVITVKLLNSGNPNSGKLPNYGK